MSLSLIQSELKAPKSQYNKFGKYQYRSLEDILESLKPLLKKYDYSLIISDDIVCIGDRVYVKATAKIYDKNMKVVAENIAFARESLSKKGMDDSQITGSTSTYARKYCLNGLFCIDDTKDADSMDNNQEPKKANNIKKNWEEFDNYVQTISNTNGRDFLKNWVKIDLSNGKEVNIQVRKFLSNKALLKEQCDNYMFNLQQQRG